ncbi:MAG TPA: hypothetical protein VL625_02925 [Patescibacteria group bacterium]|nr:hypothetical protein [Patescibacteria group bacterium]
MSDDILVDPDTPHPKGRIDKIVEALPMPVRKLGWDITLSAFFNACAYVSHTLPALVGSEGTVMDVVEKSADSLAHGTLKMAIGITAGRHLGGLFGMAADKMGDRTDSKYRRAFAAAGAVLAAPAYFLYESGAWIPAAQRAVLLFDIALHSVLG